MATIEVKNDYMLGRQNETILYKKCIELEIRIEKAKEYIKEKFTNDDGTIWHEDIKKIYEILED